MVIAYIEQVVFTMRLCGLYRLSCAISAVHHLLEMLSVLRDANFPSGCINITFIIGVLIIALPALFELTHYGRPHYSGLRERAFPSILSIFTHVETCEKKKEGKR